MKRNKFAGLADKLGYAFLIDNVIVMKDGALQAVFRFYGDDVESVVDEMRVAYSLRWSEAVCNIWSRNIMIEHDVIRTQAENYSDDQVFPSIASALIDQERRYQFDHTGDIYESLTYVTITFKEDKEISKATKKFIYNTNDQVRDKTPNERLADFNNKLQLFMNFVAYGNESKFSRLNGDALMQYCHLCITGKRQYVAAPNQGTLLNLYLAREPLLPGQQPMIGNKYIKTLTIDDYPMKLQPMLMHVLNTMRMPFRYHTRFYVLSKDQAKKELRKIQRTWSSKAIGMKGVLVQAIGGTPQLNEDAQGKNLDAQACITENESGEIKYGFYNGCIVFMHEDIIELNRIVSDFTDILTNLGFLIRNERANATEAYLGSISGHGMYNCRINLMDSISWAYQLPLSSIYAGERYCPSPLYPEHSPALLYAVTDGSNVYRLNLHVSDVGHTMVLGPTGSGKSTLLGIIMSQHLKYPNARIVIFDKDSSHKNFTRSHEGKYYSPEDLTTAKLAPFISIDEVYGFEIIHNWLCDTFEINGVSMDSSRRMIVKESLSNLRSLPQAERKFSNLEFQEKELRSAYVALKGGFFGSLMDGTSNDLFTSSLLAFDIGEILKLPEHIFVPIIECLNAQIELLSKSLHPCLLVMEEAWLYLDTPILERKLKDWLKTLRKFNIAVIFVSQSLADVSKSSITEVLSESSATKIYLPNAEALSAKVKAQYEKFSLNDKEISLITNGTPKRHYYISQATGKRLIDLNLGELALSFLAVSNEAERALFDQYYRESDPMWIVEYLTAKGLKDAADFAKRTYIAPAINADIEEPLA
ncbi:MULTISPECIES: TraG/VirB4 family ATPase [Cysteiniphilum]|uniref:Conjugal transfer protein TrbE n=1 Tax=Cysteiniphilum litorale TaxID=2056700 RepID=A0A8J3E969_9GAMM|nr:MULTISPECIES: DUF87 domain-containing protein [Cysteiniphilum]GGF99131.1 conjugal transfer protein TrbE [Cysteiniphilum litorale]